MKKVFTALTVLALSLALTAPLLAAGGKVQGAKGKGSVIQGTTNKGGAPMPRTGR